MKVKFVLLVLTAFMAVGVSNARGQWVHAIEPPGNGGSSIISVGETLFAATSSGIFRSNDNAGTWLAVDSGWAPASNLTVFMAMGNVLFAGFPSWGYDNSPGELFRSTDLGKSWTTLDSGTGLGFAIASLASSGNNLFEGIDYDDGCGNLGGGIFLSSDSGATWNNVSSGLPSPNYSDGVTDGIVTIATNGSDVFVVPGGNALGCICQSTDLGADWNEVNSQLDPNSYAFVGITIFAGGRFGVYRTMDSSITWDKVNIGLKDTNVNDLASNGNRLFAATPSGVFFSNDLGTRWTDMSQGLPPQPDITSLLVDGNFLFAGTDSLGVWRRPLSDFPPVAAPASVANQAEATSSFNYPNPFAESTTITFSVPVSGIADVSIVNLLGSEVAKLYEGSIEAGEHSFVWDASGMNPGMYECVIQQNNQIRTIPLLLER